MQKTADERVFTAIVALVAIITIAIIFQHTVREKTTSTSQDHAVQQQPNRGGLAVLSTQDFNDFVLSSQFAPPWDVFHSNTPLLESNPQNVTASDKTIQIQLAHKANNPVQLTYEKIYIRNAETEEWKSFTLTQGKSSNYQKFISGPTWINIPSSEFAVGDNYVAAFFCTDVITTAGSSQPACGCSGTTSSSCGKWNLQRVTATGIWAPYVDTVKPTATISNPQSGVTFNVNTPPITFRLTDNYDSVINYKIYVDNEAEPNPGTATNNTSVTVNLTPQQNGAHQIRVEARDAAGNVQNSTAVSITISLTDNTPPSQVSGLQSTGSTANSIALSWTASTDNANGAGIALYRVYRGTANIANVSAPAVVYTDSGLSSGQSYTYSIVAVDNAGNAGQPSSTIIATTSSAPAPGDTTPPTSTITSPDTGAVLNTATPAISFRLTDNAAPTILYTVFVGNTADKTGIASNNTVTSTTLSALQQGTFTIRVQANDSQNPPTNSSPITIIIDSVGPLLTLARVISGSTTYNSAGLEVTTNEVALCKYSTVSGTSFAAMTPFSDSSKTGTHQTTVSGLAPGQSFTYYVNCQDSAANQGTQATIQFNTLQQFQCGPSTVNQVCPAGAATAAGYDCGGAGNTCRTCSNACLSATAVTCGGSLAPSNMCTGATCPGSGTMCASGNTCNTQTGTCVSCLSSCPSASTIACGQAISGNLCSGGSCSGTGTMCASGSTCISGACQPNAWQVSVSVSGSGTVTSNPILINCPGTCTASFTSATTLTATPATGYTFSGWSGSPACSGTGMCSISGATSVTATFTINSYTLTVQKSGSGSGTISSNPASAISSCSTTCSASFTHGQSVILTATPAASTSVTWSEPGCTGNTCTVSVTAAKTVTATFTPAPTNCGNTIVNSGEQCDGSAMGTGTCVSQRGPGWSGALSCFAPGTANECQYNTGSCTFTCNAANKDVACPAPGAGVTTSTTGYQCLGSGNGICRQVTSTCSAPGDLNKYCTAASGSSGNGYSCAAGAQCSCSETDSSFCSRLGKTCGTVSGTDACGNARTVTSCGTCSGGMVCGNQNTCVAQYTLNVIKAGLGSGTVGGSGIACGFDCSETVPSGTQITLLAAPGSSSGFAGWSGACSGSSSQCTVTVSSATSVTAIFNDVSSPAVSFTAPSDGFYVPNGGPYPTMQATASDNIGVDRVVFYTSVNGGQFVQQCVVYAPGPYTCDWYASGTSTDLPVTMQAVAYDTSGNSNSAYLNGGMACQLAPYKCVGGGGGFQ